MNEVQHVEISMRWRWALLAVLGLAVLVRLWGVAYGLPYSYWTDEYHELMRAMQLGAGSFNFARSTKGGFYLLLFIEYGIYYVALRLLGLVSSTREFAENFARDPTMFYLIGRSTAALLGAMTVAGAYWITRRAYSLLAALIAAGLLTINVLHVDLSHRIGVDVPMTLFATLSLVFGLRVANAGSRRDYVLAALFAALATTSKLPGILVLIPLLIAHAGATSSTGLGWAGWFRSRSLWMAVGVFAAILVATDPGIILHTGFVKYLPGLGKGPAADDGMDAFAEFATMGERPNLYLYYLSVLRDSMGWPMFLFSMAAIGYAVWKRTRTDVMLISYAAINYLVIASTSSETLYYPRYTLPIIVVLVVLTGRAAADLMRAIPRWRMAVGTAGIVVLCAWPAWRVAVDDHALTLTDTRTTAKAWFESHVPAGAKVLVEGGKVGPKRESVQLRDSRESLERRIAYWKTAEPRQARFLEAKLATTGDGGYDLELVRLQSIATLADYARNGVEYFVVRPEYFLASRKASSNAARLVDDLRSDPRVTLLKRFVPDSPDHPGVEVEIYRLAVSGQPPAH